jgi:hypothetical protein
MYRRPILCTLYDAVDFLNVLKKGCWWGGGSDVAPLKTITYRAIKTTGTLIAIAVRYCTVR